MNQKHHATRPIRLIWILTALLAVLKLSGGFFGVSWLQARSWIWVFTPMWLPVIGLGVWILLSIMYAAWERYLRG